MLAELGSMAITGLLATEYFVPVIKPEEIDNPFVTASTSLPQSRVTSAATTGSHKVGSYAQSKWLIDSDAIEVRVAALYDLETEIEVIQEQLYELLTNFAAHWVIRGVVTGLATIEIADLFYIKL